MSKIEASAKIKIPTGLLEEYKRQLVEYIKQIKEKDTGTLQFDWFISGDKTECEIRENYVSSESALAHQNHLRELQEIIFKKFGLPYSVVIYGDS
jgi:quinol monooxygenase YgiN